MKTTIQTKSTIIVISLAAIMITGNSDAQTFTQIDTSIVCTIGGYSNFGSFGDFNNDGLDDLIIINTSNTPDPNSHFLFVNEGNWNFRQITEGDVAVYSSTYGAHGANWGDYDNDGDLDLFLANHFNNNNVFFVNNGDGSFTQVKEGSLVNDGGDSGPATWIDIENDGYLDLYVVNQQQQKNFLYHNQGNGTFTKINGGELASYVFKEDLGPYSVDIDNDRDDDIFGSAIFDRNYLYINDGNGNFTPVESGEILNNPFMSSFCGWGDYNNDGYLDVFAPTINRNLNTGEWLPENDLLYQNNGDGTFSKVTGIAPVNEQNFTDDGCWADFDNDGYLDLFTSVIDDTRNSLFKNNSDGTFTKLDVAAFTDVIGGHTSISDMNNDGFMDIFIARGYGMFGGPEENVIFVNDGNANNWLTVKLSGTVSNKSAIGARVKAKASIDGTPIWQTREIGVSGLAGHTHAHFGLGDAALIDTLIVEWPAGHDTILADVAVNQILSITEDMPDGYLRASFAVDTTMGRGEVTVQFTDISRFDPTNPVTSWSWDFDNDGTEDSDEQNPVHLYSNPMGEVYDVSLIVSNGTNSDTITRNDFIRLYPLMAENLAQWGTATASSEESPIFNAQNAIDGVMLSRWASVSGSDNEWLKVEMDSVYTVGKVVIHWEAAYATQYQIQTSLDDENWETVYCEQQGNGSEDIIYFTGIDAKYVKLVCFDRTTIEGEKYGYSIYEFEIYRSDGNIYDDNCPTGLNDPIKSDGEISVYPNPFNESVTFLVAIEKPDFLQLDVLDLSGKKITTVYSGQLDAGEHSLTWERTDIDDTRVGSGFYIYHLQIGDNYISNGKLIIID